MDKKSSDEVAHQAAQLLGRPSPLEDDTVVDAIIRNVVDAVATGTQDMARNAIREPLMPYIETCKSFAGSVVSQADGPE